MMDISKNSVVFFTLLCINGVLSAVDSVTFSVQSGSVPNLDGTTSTSSFTVRSNSQIEMRCTYNALPETGEIATTDFQIVEGTNILPIYKYLHPPRKPAENPVIYDPFKTPLRITRSDGQIYGGIQIDPVLLSDDKVYKCLIINTSFFQKASSNVKVNVVAIPQTPTLSVTPGPLIAGNRLTLTCTTNTGKPKGALTWKRQLSTESSPTVIQKNTTVTDLQNSDGSYQISETHIVDILSPLDNGAKYTCEARNAALTPSEGSPKSEVALDVKYQVKDIKVTPESGPHYPGDTTFTCAALGNPAPSYQWTKINGTQSLTINGAVLMVPDDATEEVLFYKCEAYNTPSTSEVRISYTLHVNITAKPTTTTTTTEATTVPPTSAPSRTTPGSTGTAPKPPGPATGAVVDAGMIGGIVGALVAIILIVIIVICVCRNKKKKEVENVEKGEKFKGEVNNTNNVPMGGYDVEMDDNFNAAEDPKKKNLEGLVYADLNFDDRPRSRKPIQIQEDFDRTDYADIRRV